MTDRVPARVLVVGGGAREHALAMRLAGEPGTAAVVVAPGSAGIASGPGVRTLPLDPLDPVAVVAAARAAAADLVVVGPEAPLAAGVADALDRAGIPVLGPTAAAARLEASKAFCHEVAAEAGVRMARAGAFAGGEIEAARAFVLELAAAGAGAVLKADGLAAGKGVVVTRSTEEALALVPAFLDGRPGGAPALVVEERLEGPEASVIALCDGARAIALPAARDHKRLRDGDDGPNTGGMGAYAPLPDLGDDAVGGIVATVHLPILAAMRARGTPFRGFLYAGLILTATGPVLLETNARLGDPEAQVLLPLIAEPLGPLLLAAARGALPAGRSRVATRAGAAVGIVLAAPGYPEAPRPGAAILGIDAARATGALVLHAGTAADGRGGWSVSGGRVLTVVATGPGLAAARSAAERAADLVSWEGLQRRRDIAAAPPSAAAAAAASAPAAAGDGR